MRHHGIERCTRDGLSSSQRGGRRRTGGGPHSYFGYPQFPQLYPQRAGRVRFVGTRIYRPG
ncbi:hypothetical protein BST12_20930 [Mycobacterium angelicum]|uniref:Uncharacterized protein n=1 Tax=Mycobacterium angelicum TaxID=470074 RepID=A0A1W9ZJS1_MYCAN|nr:hypothetical protein BST12_20930 [Mycobacterium angelicum]